MPRPPGLSPEPRGRQHCSNVALGQSNPPSAEVLSGTGPDDIDAEDNLVGTQYLTVQEDPGGCRRIPAYPACFDAGSRTGT